MAESKIDPNTQYNTIHGLDQLIDQIESSFSNIKKTIIKDKNPVFIPL